MRTHTPMPLVWAIVAVVTFKVYYDMITANTFGAGATVIGVFVLAAFILAGVRITAWFGKGEKHA